MTRYQHRQFAKAMSMGLGLVALIFLLLGFLMPPTIYFIYVASALILPVVAFLFSSLSIEISG